LIHTLQTSILNMTRYHSGHLSHHHAKSTKLYKENNTMKIIQTKTGTFTFTPPLPFSQHRHSRETEVTLRHLHTRWWRTDEELFIVSCRLGRKAHSLHCFQTRYAQSYICFLIQNACASSVTGCQSRKSNPQMAHCREQQRQPRKEPCPIHEAHHRSLSQDDQLVALHLPKHP